DLAPGFELLRLRSFRDEQGRELLDLPRAPLVPEDTPAPPRLLPRWDELLLAHKDRTRVLPDEYRKAAIQRNGDVQQPSLVGGGRGARGARAGNRTGPEPFAPLPRTARRELEAEAARLNSWLG